MAYVAIYGYYVSACIITKYVLIYQYFSKLYHSINTATLKAVLSLPMEIVCGRVFYRTCVGVHTYERVDSHQSYRQLVCNTRKVLTFTEEGENEANFNF